MTYHRTDNLHRRVRIGEHDPFGLPISPLEGILNHVTEAPLAEGC